MIDYLTIICIGLTVAVYIWFSSHDYSGDYNFTSVFTVPAAIAGVVIIWLIYFAGKYFGV